MALNRWVWDAPAQWVTASKAKVSPLRPWPCHRVQRHPCTRFLSVGYRIGRLFPQRKVVLDGEIVCLDENGHPQFEDLLFRRDREQAMSVLDTLKTTSKNSLKIVLADPRTALAAAFGTGTHLVIYKPLSADRLRGYVVRSVTSSGGSISGCTRASVSTFPPRSTLTTVRFQRPCWTSAKAARRSRRSRSR